MKNDDSITEAISWIRSFMNVQTMNIHQQMVIFFGKTMKLYSNTVILSLKIYEKILKSNFVMEGGGGGY